MSVTAAIDRIRSAAEQGTLAELAREADVPLTTVRSFAERGWTHKNLEVVDKLAAAADRLSHRRRRARAA